MGRVVIVGAGQAGGRTALTLRKEEFADEVVLIGTEPHPPYQRPPLSKAVLLDTKTVEQGYLVARDEYAKRDIALRCGETVSAIDPERRRLTVADEEMDYDVLVLATGAVPRGLNIPGAELDNVFLLRTAHDAERIRGALEPESRIAIVGGGFIGLEVAASARQRCCSVTLLEAQDRLLSRSLPTAAAEVVASLHRDRGVNLTLQAEIAGFEGDGAVSGIRLRDDSVLPVDAVVVGIGITPDTALADAAGLKVDDGVVVDGLCRTSADAVYAVGDCARVFLARYGRHVRLESYQNADLQGATAARHITGKDIAYDPVPWLWSQQYDWVCQTAGFPTEGDRLISRGDYASEYFMSFSFDQERLIGVAGVGRGAGVARDLRQAQMAMEKGLVPDESALADAEVPVKSVFQG